MPHETILLTVEMLLLLAAIGAVGGFLSGLLGIGGGVLFVPALFFCLSSLGVAESQAMHTAVGTSLALVCLTGASAVLAHWRRGGVDYEHIRLWLLPLLGGVATGSLLAGTVESTVLRAFFGGICAIICLSMILPLPQRRAACLIVPRRVQKAVMAVIGFLSSLIGIGGAVMTVPFMTLMGFAMPRAAGTGSALGMVIALPGALFYMVTGLLQSAPLLPYSVGYVSLIALAVMVPAAVLTAPFGVQIAYRLPRPVLRRVFAFVLLLVSMRMLMSL